MPAGRYRLRAWVIAQAQSGSTVNGVSIYAGSNSQTCTHSGTPQEYMIEFSLENAQDLEIGLDIASTTNAKWVAFDNWSLKYFGTADGEIVEKDRNTPILGVDPQKVYRIKHLNPSRNRYMAATPNANDYLLTTNDNAQKGEFSLLPVLGKQGYYYIYNTEGYFVTPSTTNWKLSRTTPAEVLVTLNNANRGSVDGSGDNNIYLLGESSQHANPQNKNSTELVYAYSAHDTDKGNNWILEEVSNATATLSLTQVTSAIESLVQSADAENVSMTYSVPAASYGYQTFSSDYALDFSETTTKAYIATSTDAGNVYFEQIMKVPAGTGLLLQGIGDETIPVLTTDDTDVSKNLLCAGDGSAVSKEDGYNKYVLALDNDNTNVSFYLINGTSATVEKGKAYLKVASGSSNARQLRFSFDDPTNIKTITQDDRVGFNGQGSIIYNMAGQRIDKPTKGLYIKNGKKYIR